MSAECSKWLQLAARTAENAYSPYSGVARGAVLVAEDGTAYAGCSVEFASFSGSLCAEMSALAQAVAQGKRKFRILALAPGGFPCGGCRQALAEFGLDLLVVSTNCDGKPVESVLSQLLPASFGPANLG
jgi:cytidine deaminase